MATGRAVGGKYCRGFTYVALLLGVAIVGVWIAATASVWHLTLQREKEQELLFIGNEFRAAINHYWRSSGATARRYPMHLEDLLQDERLAEKRRHLRRIYTDPMTGKSEWGLIRLKDGQIIGVRSLSEQEPIKKAGFRVRDQGFVGKTRYTDWLFIAVPSATAGAPTARPSTLSALMK
jgi:type II secretory pathway pseudopilin PulG